MTARRASSGWREHAIRLLYSRVPFPGRVLTYCALAAIAGACCLVMLVTAWGMFHESVGGSGVLGDNFVRVIVVCMLYLGYLGAMATMRLLLNRDPTVLRRSRLMLLSSPILVEMVGGMLFAEGRSLSGLIGPFYFGLICSVVFLVVHAVHDMLWTPAMLSRGRLLAGYLTLFVLSLAYCIFVIRPDRSAGTRLIAPLMFLLTASQILWAALPWLLHDAAGQLTRAIPPRPTQTPGTGDLGGMLPFRYPWQTLWRCLLLQVPVIVAAIVFLMVFFAYARPHDYLQHWRMPHLRLATVMAVTWLFGTAMGRDPRAWLALPAFYLGDPLLPAIILNDSWSPTGVLEIDRLFQPLPYLLWSLVVFVPFVLLINRPRPGIWWIMGGAGWLTAFSYACCLASLHIGLIYWPLALYATWILWAGLPWLIDEARAEPSDGPDRQDAPTSLHRPPPRCGRVVVPVRTLGMVAALGVTLALLNMSELLLMPWRLVNHYSDFGLDLSWSALPVVSLGLVLLMGWDRRLLLTLLVSLPAFVLSLTPLGDQIAVWLDSNPHSSGPWLLYRGGVPLYLTLWDTLILGPPALLAAWLFRPRPSMALVFAVALASLLGVLLMQYVAIRKSPAELFAGAVRRMLTMELAAWTYMLRYMLLFVWLLLPWIVLEAQGRWEPAQAVRQAARS